MFCNLVYMNCFVKLIGTNITDFVFAAPRKPHHMTD